MANTKSQERWKKTHPAKMVEQNRTWRKRHPEKYEAHRLVNGALRRGDLVRPAICEACGRYDGWNGEPLPGRGVIEAHHRDYTKPFDIEWLCRLCHGEVD